MCGLDRRARDDNSLYRHLLTRAPALWKVRHLPNALALEEVAVNMPRDDVADLRVAVIGPT
jgi:hypothetical protein